MSDIGDILSDIGADISDAVLDVGANLTAAIDNFNLQNLSPGDIFNAAVTVAQSIGGIGESIPGRIPSLNRLPGAEAASGGINSVPAFLRQGGGGGGGGSSNGGGGVGGTWESTHYADDMNAHHPKFKFLFKVKFEGFGSETFYRYVLRCDRPKIRYNHVDVNYYNFRTRVLTGVTYDPLSITFLDEIGNSVNQFFTTYHKKRTGTGDGNYGIDKGFVNATSYPYEKGYADSGAKITIEQVFANGTLTNRFEFINPRIESFDFDELNMDDNAGSLLTCQFSYDAIRMKTVQNSVLYTWGETDLLRGGGTSGSSNGGAQSLGESGDYPPVYANGNGIGGGGSYETIQPGTAYNELRGGSRILSGVPGSLADLVNPAIGLFTAQFNQNDIIGSAGDLVQRGIQETLDSVRSGANLVFGGNDPNSTSGFDPDPANDIPPDEI